MRHRRDGYAWADPGRDEAATAPPPFVNGVPFMPQKPEVGGFCALHFAEWLYERVPALRAEVVCRGIIRPHFEQLMADTFS